MTVLNHKESPAQGSSTFLQAQAHEPSEQTELPDQYGDCSTLFSGATERAQGPLISLLTLAHFIGIFHISLPLKQQTRQTDCHNSNNLRSNGDAMHIYKIPPARTYIPIKTIAVAVADAVQTGPKRCTATNNE